MRQPPKFDKDEEKGLVKKSVFSGNQACRATEMTDYALVPLVGLQRIARRYMLGDVRYGRDNWKRGGDQFLYDSVNHAIEHLHKYAAGDVSEDHLGAVGWFVTMAAWHEANGTMKSAKQLYDAVGDIRKLAARMRDDK